MHTLISSAVAVLASTLLLGLAYFGSKIVLETILGRHWG